MRPRTTIAGKVCATMTTSVSPPLGPAPLPELTPRQEAALAKLAYAAEQPGALAVLCGPDGVGKTTVLRHEIGRAHV